MDETRQFPGPIQDCLEADGARGHNVLLPIIDKQALVSVGFDGLEKRVVGPRVRLANPDVAGDAPGVNCICQAEVVALKSGPFAHVIRKAGDANPSGVGYFECFIEARR